MSHLPRNRVAEPAGEGNVVHLKSARATANAAGMTPGAVASRMLLGMLDQAARPAAVHTVEFQENIVSGKWRARCSCGWYAVGTEQGVANAAATHDL